ncbi:hypothetical protein BMS3Abin10_01670 [bacterium BMS3Abin10]|nr:hypothetical protein BMS3Abin10_01670 [bacterium BMS3Abin10]GBE38576.1 hypothetical protein BMS3Bbin08_01183 [bacterium BMS3Bbin08]
MAPHRFAAQRFVARKFANANLSTGTNLRMGTRQANLKHEGRYSLEVQREYLESFADMEGHPHGFATSK